MKTAGLLLFACLVSICSVSVQADFLFAAQGDEGLSSAGEPSNQILIDLEAGDWIGEDDRVSETVCVPEPGTLVILGLGVLLLIQLNRHKRHVM